MKGENTMKIKECDMNLIDRLSNVELLAFIQRHCFAAGIYNEREDEKELYEYELIDYADKLLRKRISAVSID